jgi:hypothetical protein
MNARAGLVDTGWLGVAAGRERELQTSQVQLIDAQAKYAVRFCQRPSASQSNTTEQPDM